MNRWGAAAVLVLVLCGALWGLSKVIDLSTGVNGESDVRGVLDELGHDYTIEGADPPDGAKKAFVGTMTNDQGVSLDWAVAICEGDDPPACPEPALDASDPMMSFAGGIGDISWASNGFRPRPGDTPKEKRSRGDMAAEFDNGICFEEADFCGG
jgi:hypothetical protein